MPYDEKADGTEIEVSPGEEFDLALPETPTAGYRWVKKDSEPTCPVIEDSRATTAKTGGTGTHSWRFRAPASGSCSVQLEYKRSWETKPARTFNLKVRVRS